MFPFGSIVLARFPFTDLSGDKRRPALVVSRVNPAQSDVIVCFITSVQRAGLYAVPIGETTATGLKQPSVVLLGKVATLNHAVITGRIGNVGSEWLVANRDRFFSVFGFDALTA